MQMPKKIKAEEVTKKEEAPKKVAKKKTTAEVAVVAPQPTALMHTLNYTADQVELIKRTVAVGATDDELQMFMYQAKKSGLDPLARQIHFVKREKNVKKGNDWVKESVATIQTGIDGFRVVAERHGDYAGQDEPKFEYRVPSQSIPSKAVVTVYKFSKDGVRYPAAVGVALWDEFKASYKKKDYKTGVETEMLSPMWLKMPHTMLAKCAEAQALRKAFPQDLSGIYTTEEMAQAENQDDPGTDTPQIAPKTATRPAQQPTAQPAIELASEGQRKMIFGLASNLGIDGERAKETVKAYFKLESFTQLTKTQAMKVIEQLNNKQAEPLPLDKNGELID